MSSTDQNQRFLEANRSRWNEVVPIHANSDFYGVERFLAGETTLLPLDFDEVGDVRGKTLLHLQCHFGLDTLSWARAGANVVGLDFAPAAIAEARRLAERAALTARFVESDVHDAAEALPDLVSAVDIVYVNLGAICWLPQISRWAQTCAQFLRPGGVLYVRDVHPVVWCLDEEDAEQRLVLRYPYFEQVEPHSWPDAADYADPDAMVKHEMSYEWNHGIGEIVSALIEAGLQVQFLHEQDWTVYRALPWMSEVEPGIWRLPDAAPRVPLMFSLRALRPQDAV